MPSNSKEYQSEYYQKNKNIIKEKNNEFIFCDVCQCNIRRCYLKIHNETSKHNKIPKQKIIIDKPKPKQKIIVDKEKKLIVKKTLIFLKEILEPDEYIEVEEKSKLLYQTKQDVIIKEEVKEEQIQM
jgi:hypothetical protein